MIPLLALTGIFQPPDPEGGYTAIPMLSDPSSSSLFVFITFPGAYDDVYEIASKVKFANIFLVPISLNANYVSDIHRLVTDLTPLKSIVKILYPGYYELPVNNLNELAIIRGDGNTATFTFPNGFIAFDYYGSCDCACRTCEDVCDECAPGADINNTHDIYVRWNDKGYLFTSFNVTRDRILELFQKKLLDYVYVPYSPCIDNEGFLTLITDPELKEYANSIIAYGFHSFEDFITCYKQYPLSTPMTYRYAFMEDDTVSPTHDFDPVIGTKYFCPSIFFTDYQRVERPSLEGGEEVHKFYLPVDRPNLPESPDYDHWEYTTMEIPTATTVLCRTVKHDEIPFRLFFFGYATDTYYEGYESTETMVETIDKIKIGWDEINFGYHDYQGKFNRILFESNELYVSTDPPADVVEPEDTVKVTLFNTTKRDYDAKKNLFRFREYHLFVSFLDTIEGVEEPEFPPEHIPIVPDESDILLITKDDINDLF